MKKKKSALHKTDTNLLAIVPGSPAQTLDGASGKVEQVYIDQPNAFKLTSILLKMQNYNEPFNIPADLIAKESNRQKVLLT